MERLASEIRDNLDSLAATYEGRLHLADGGEFARGQLSLIVHCLEIQDGAPFLEAMREHLPEGTRVVPEGTRVVPEGTRAAPRDAGPLPGVFLQRALAALEQTLLPLVTDVQAATFLWGILSQAREELLQQTAPQGVDAGGQRTADDVPAKDAQVEGDAHAATESPTIALGESEELFRLVVEHSLAGIFIVDDRFRFIYTNDQLLDLVGYPRQEVMGENFQRFLDEESKQLVTERYVRRQRGEDVPPRYEFNILRRDGEKRRVEISSVTVKDPMGRVRTLAQLTDVTERRRLEERIRGLLERRGQQVRTSTEVAQEIAATGLAGSALDELYRRVVTLIQERFDYYHTQLFLADRQGERVVTVASASSFSSRVGQALLDEGHHILVGEGVVGRAAASGQPVLSSDTSQEPAWLPHPLLPETRGELAVPIVWRDRVLGVLDVQSDRAGALTEDDQLLLEGLCGQIAIAIESTRLRQEMEGNLAELERLYRTMSREGWDVVYDQLPSLGYRFDGEKLELADTPYSAEDASLSGAEGGIDGDSPDVVVPLDVRGHRFGLLGVRQAEENPLSAEDQALVESVAEQVSLALESARLFGEEQQARALLGLRVRELDCLNDIGRVIDEGPAIPDLLAWVAGRIPAAMQVPDRAVAAIEFDGQIYGAAQALDLPRQIVQALYIGSSAPMGRVCIAYREAGGQEHAAGAVPGADGPGTGLAFLDEESALLGDITRRLVGYIENQRLMAETREAAERLERERFLLRTVIDNMPDLVYAKDTKSRFTVNNRAHLQVLGASSQEEVLGKTDLDVFPEEYGSRYYDEEQEIIRTGEALVDHEHQDFYQAIDKRAWVVTTKLPLRGPDGEIYGLVGLTRDITERKRAESIEQRRQRQLQSLSDIGQQAGSSLPVPEFLEWVVGRIPGALQYPELGLAAIEYEGELYGSPLAVAGPDSAGGDPGLAREYSGLACQMVQNLRIGEEVVGRICVAYAPARDGVGDGIGPDGGAGAQANGVRREDLAFLDEESALLGDIGRRVAGFLENRRLFLQAEARAAELAVLNELGQALPTRPGVDSVLFEGYRAASRLLDASDFYVTIYESAQEGPGQITFPLIVEDGQLTRPYHRRPADRRGLTEYLVETRRPLLIRESMGQRLEELGIESIRLGAGRQALSWLGVPMTIGDRVLGTMVALSFTRADLYDEHDLELLVAVANRVAVALENVHLLQRAQTRAEQERLVRTITDRVRRGVDRQAIMRVALREIGDMLGASTAVVRLGTAGSLQEQMELPRSPSGDARPAPGAGDGASSRSPAADAAAPTNGDT